MDAEEKDRQAEYLDLLSQLNRKLVCWKTIRTLITTLFVLFLSRQLDTTLVIRLIHQVASLESINWKETSSRTNASKIISMAVGKREKELDPEAREETASESSANIVQSSRTGGRNAKTSPCRPATENNNDALIDLTGRVGKPPELPDRQASESITSESPNSQATGRQPGWTATFVLNAARVMVILIALMRASRKPSVRPQCSSNAAASHPKQPQRMNHDQGSGECYGSISSFRGYDTFHNDGLRSAKVGEHEPLGAVQPDHPATDRVHRSPG
ncbi:hypothetical protein LX32DRAFT_223041 [Colletotrichum zoysiae]|uniref:Uncharacterized protein n=1 Tax=Colletotrichum zoysiae TaxID=1216348 RepID=A0AAD9H4F5_9PEZI|nr:hypothetical protein LX32DRAFT_223041 [Colletotrichum zoysiae]